MWATVCDRLVRFENEKLKLKNFVDVYSEPCACMVANV